MEIFDKIHTRLQALAETKTTCDQCGTHIGRCYTHWPALAMELAVDPKQKGKLVATPPTPPEPMPIESSVREREYIPTKEFHFCGEDCLREFLVKRNS